MTATEGEEGTGSVRPPSTQPTAAAEGFRLRGDIPRVTRLSRKVLIGLGGMSALAVAGALGYGLQSHKPSGTASNLYDTQTHAEADGLSSLPKSYAGLAANHAPKLGPPLPGDLGPAIVNAHATTGTALMASGMNSNARRLAQQQQAALASKLFVQEDRQPTDQHSRTANGNVGMLAAGPSLPATTTATNSKTAFMSEPVDRRTVSPEQLQKPASPYVVQAGTVIPAALITGIRSDLPGQIIAQVTQDVYDSPTGRYLLIPQGAKLIGQYDSSVTFGQSRVLLVWTRLIMPDGGSIVLDRLPGADTQGYAGLYDRVNNHWGMLFDGAILSTILSVGAEAGTSNSGNNLAQALRMGASNSISQTGQQIVQRELDVQPTLTIRPGFPVDVMVTRDLVLAPYGTENTP
ncbi:TrbI/VirB10 family protein [Acidiphilium sp. AL]|uniref:TrbI/VirB10 family protein n=1 Tax=Acidiphilium sp. AL TaxID=2871704 RepID=UPI0021CB8AEF|nr:TrbI/VirB10 family protein [Acidiphilium sp. AL]MCU4161426.1 TrbI/VirB10 family protein [Acidiphilium sp. AL]